MKNLKYIFIVFFLLLGFACEDVLDLQPTDVVAETNFWQSSTDAEAGLVAVYDALRTNLSGGGVRSVFSWERWGAFDFFTQMGIIRNGGINSLVRGGGQGAVWRDFGRAWGLHYSGLVRANDFLINIDPIPFPDENRKDHAIGEARFLRAMYSYAITMMWGDVPYFDDVPTLEDVGPDKVSQAEIIEEIKSDLAIALDLLPDVPDDIGRAGKGAAHMLRLKVALFEEDWQTARDQAEAVRDLGMYALHPNYADIFTLENENNSEVIFDVQSIADSDIEPAGTMESMYSGRFSSNRGLSWMAPGLWLVDKYERIDDNPSYVQEDPRITDTIYQYFEGRDPRMDANIIRPGAHFIGIGNQDFLYPFVPNYTHSRTGLHSRKYVITGDNSRDGDDQSPLNFIIFRYADALLHLAEASAQLSGSGSDQTAIDILNQIRLRASDQLPQYDVASFASVEELLTAIYDERIRELAMEGWLYWDFKRWGLIEERDGFGILGVKQSGDNPVEFDTTPDEDPMQWISGKDELFPIPQTEVDLTGMRQNPGW